MTKKLIALVFAIGCSSAAYGGSTFMGGAVLNSWQFAVSVSASYYTVSNDLLTIPDVGFHVGLFGNLEFGVRAYKTGLTADLKYVFINNFPFILSLDLEADFASTIAGGAAIFLDLELNSFTAVYLSARWRYPSITELDIANIPRAGTVFLARFGIEILRHSFLTFNVEGGAVTSWASPAVGLNIGAMVTWKIN